MRQDCVWSLVPTQSEDDLFNFYVCGYVSPLNKTGFVKFRRTFHVPGTPNVNDGECLSNPLESAGTLRHGSLLPLDQQLCRDTWLFRTQRGRRNKFADEQFQSLTGQLRVFTAF